MTQTSVLRLFSNSLPVRLETKAILVPSGDQRGSESFQSAPSVICFAAPLLTSTTQRCARRSSNQPVSLNLYRVSLYYRTSLSSFLSVRLSLGSLRHVIVLS